MAYIHATYMLAYDRFGGSMVHMPAKILSDSEVLQLIRRGFTPTEVANYYAEKYNVEVTPEAVSMMLYRKGISLGLKPRYSDLIPWVIAPSHTNRYPAKLLRFEARRRAGLRLSPENLRKLENWKRKMEQDGTVVAYERDVEPGWFYVPRRPGVDLDLIREPD